MEDAGVLTPDKVLMVRDILDGVYEKADDDERVMLAIGVIGGPSGTETELANGKL